MRNRENTIWLINQYASTPDTGMGGRSYYMAKALSELGYVVYLVSGSFNHKLRAPKQINGLFDVEEVAGLFHVRLRVLRYIGSSSKVRVVNWFLFAVLLFVLRWKRLAVPHAIIYSSPSLIGYWGARALARHYGARLTFEARDLWPLTLMELGGYGVNHPLIRFLQFTENVALREADSVVSNLRNAKDYMRHHGMQADKFTWVANGIRLEEVNDQEVLSEDVEAAVAGEFVVGYTGSIGRANALDVLVKAADLLRDARWIKFVVVGSGKDCALLKRQVKERGLSNIEFIGPIPKRQIQTLLQKCDVLYIGWRRTPLYRYGIGANKIPEYMYSGKPILHSYSGAVDPIAEVGAGITVPAEDPRAVADAILQFARMSSEERRALGARGRKIAVEEYEYGALASKLASVALGARGE